MSEALAKPGQLTIFYIPSDGRGHAKTLTVAEEVARQPLAARQDAFLGTLRVQFEAPVSLPYQPLPNVEFML